LKKKSSKQSTSKNIGKSFEKSATPQINVSPAKMEMKSEKCQKLI